MTLLIILITNLIANLIIEKRHANYQYASKEGYTGYQLNRNLAKIYSHYSQNNKILSDSFFESMIMPIPNYLYNLAINPIPRILWKNKPIDKSFTDINLLITNNDGLGTSSNVTVTVPARFYANYGVLGVIESGLFIGFFFAFLNYKLILHRHIISKSMYLFIIIYLSIRLRDYQPGIFYTIYWIILIKYLLNFHEKKN